MSTTREKDRRAAIAFSPTYPLSAVAAFMDACAHRDQQVIAYLTSVLDTGHLHSTQAILVGDLIVAIEQGRHVK